MNDKIVACARGWIGTRFHHQGRLKKTDRHKGGVDCLGLLVGVAGELGLKTPDGIALTAFDETDYSHTPDSEQLLERLFSLLAMIPAQQMQHGDIVLLKIDNSPQHLAIVSQLGSNLGIIHAYAPARAVVEHVLNDWWHQRIQSVFRFFNHPYS